MIIQWYPGHMTKALRMMEKEIKLVDAIVYVLDARAPFSCVNPKFTKLIGQKPIIYVLNKSDMADPIATSEWKTYFTKKSGYCVSLNSAQSKSTKLIENLLYKVLDQKIQKYKAKNINPTIRVMVLGVPNSGKSTLINNLSGKGKTTTGNRPGVTRGKQWVKINSGIELLDTPGTLWPAFDNNHVAKHLAYIGSIREEVLDIPGLSIELIKDVNAIDPKYIKQRYKIEFDNDNTALEVLDMVGKARGFLLKGAEINYDRASHTLVSEFKQGKFGKVSLERVKDINKLLVNHRRKEE